MSHAGLVATPERPERDPGHLSAARGSPSSSSHSLVISPNLRAALEYEERIRSPPPGAAYGSIGAGGSDWGGGLPPPPRPKSRPKPSHHSSQTPSPAGSVSIPASPVLVPSVRTGDGSGAGGLATNPYINPVPRLPYFRRDAPPPMGIEDHQADAHSTGQSSSDSLGTGSSRAVDEARVSPATASPSPSGSAGEGLRHLRGLSSLQKVEKMIGKSKKSLGMIAEGNLKLTSSWRESDGGRGDAVRRRLRGDGRKAKAASVLYASSAPTSPVSAVSVSVAAGQAAAGGGGGGGGGGAEVGQERLGGPARQPAAVVAGGAEGSHGRRGSDGVGEGATGRSWSTISDAATGPPSLPPHRPISISSTVYSASAPSFAPPSPSSSSSLRSPASRPTDMNDDRHSFIELASPTFSPTEGGHPFSAFTSPHESQPLSRTADFSPHPYASRKPLLAPLATPAKPPVPTSAKPDFTSRRSKSAQRSIELPSPTATATSRTDSYVDGERGLRDRPSTSNLLHPQERAELVRKTRKLTQMFGQTPGVGHFPVEVDFGRGHAPRANLVGAPPHPSRRKHKPAASMLDDPILPAFDATKPAVWPPADDAQYALAAARRRSVPFSPQDFSPVRLTRDPAHVIGGSRWEGQTAQPERERSGSPQSFIDLSDEEGSPAAFSDSRSPATPKAPSLLRRPDPVLSPSSPSLLDGPALSADQQLDDDRRRKRERLAKLHRFLGSRVPAHLVLGPLEEGVPLPPPASPSPHDDMSGEDADARRLRLRRRRSSSAAEFAGTWSDEIDRLKDDLNEREKAINVRRAVKMEKMFGVAPPQVLYHTRQAVSSPGSSVVPRPPLSPPPPLSPLPGARNLNQTSYKGKSKKGGRPGTAESTQPLIDHAHADTSDTWDGGGTALLTAMSDVYLHYRHSLNSLNDIIDRDDKQSLAELHDYLSGRGQDPAEHTPTEESAFAAAQAAAKAERRRSMPTRTSMTSVSSEWTLLPSPPPEENAFQQRRRRAAKLTQFFGVNYRDLMNEILESIEKGLEEERGRGTLQPDEVQDLMQKLRRLKTKRNNWP